MGAKGKCAKIPQRDALFEKNAVFSLKYPSALSLFQERICRDSKDARSELFLIGNIYMSRQQTKSPRASRSTYFGDFLEHFRKKASLMQLRTLFGGLPERIEMAGVYESLPGDVKTTGGDSQACADRQRSGRRRERASSTPFSDASLMPVGLGDGAARLLCTRITALRRGGETFLWAEPAFARARCALIGIRRILS